MADAASHALKLLGPQAHLSAQLLSSPIVDVTFADTVGAPNQTAYLVTSSRRLYRSDDSGATWNIEPLPDADDALAPARARPEAEHRRRRSSRWRLSSLIVKSSTGVVRQLNRGRNSIFSSPSHPISSNLKFHKILTRKA
jgi:hypothetical protein